MIRLVPNRSQRGKSGHRDYKKLTMNPRRAIVLLSLCLVSMGCGGGQVSAPSVAAPPMDLGARRGVSTPFDLDLSWDAEARDVELSVMGPDDGVVHRGSCRFGADDRVICDAPSHWDVGPGPYTVSLRYVAVDGIAEHRTATLTLHGDEIRISLRGWFDVDGSAGGLYIESIRRAPAGVEIMRAAEGVDGEPPRLFFVNESDGAVVVSHQGGVLGYVVHVTEDGRWERVPRAGIGGCGTGRIEKSLHPGEYDLVGEAATIGGVIPLEPGPYLFVVPFEDRETLPDEARSIRVATYAFEVEGEPVSGEMEPTFHGDWVFTDYSSELSLTPVLARPGVEAPRGQGGAALDEDAPSLEDGATIAGRVGIESPRRAYRVVGPEDTAVVVRLYARCLEAPCRASFGVMFGQPGDLGGSSGPLHRDPPGWSTKDRVFYLHDAEPHILELSCGTACANGAVEYYGRVHFVRPDDEPLTLSPEIDPAPSPRP